MALTRLSTLMLILTLAAPAAADARELRFRGAPAFVEVSGDPSHRAVVIAVHGGGWLATGPAAAALERPEAAAWAARGWTAVNVSYRPGRRSLGDVLWFYDRVRSHVGPRTPICLTGGSAGGQLALMVAVRRADVACVAARGAPTDLVTIGREQAWGPTGPQRTFPRQTQAWAIRAFGRRNLAAMSPARQAHRIRAQVLLAIGDRDPFVPWRQVERLRAALPSATAIRLPWGPAVPWIHTSVSRDASARFRSAEQELADRSAGAAR